MKCPKCQMNLKEGSLFCIHCGFQFNSPSSMITTQNNNTVQKTKASSRDFSLMVLSIVNLIVIFPTAFLFILLYFFFGQLVGGLFYYVGLLLSGIYILVSLISFPFTIWNVVKYSEKNRKMFKYGFLGAFIIFALVFACIKYFPDRLADLGEKYKEKQKISISAEKKLYVDENVEIDVYDVRHDSLEERVEIKMLLTNRSDAYYSFDVNKIKVNGQDSYFWKESSSNFGSTFSKMVDIGDSSNDYIIYIRDDDLDDMNLNYYKIDKLSFLLTLYCMEMDSPNAVPISFDQYYDVEL